MTKIKKITIKTNCGEFMCHFAADSNDPGYTVTVPSLKGMVTEGRTLVRAKKMAREAIELHCEGLLVAGLAKVVPLKTHTI